MNNTSLADLSLYLAAAEQGLESRQRTAAVWGKNLNADQYVYRDAVMDAQEHAADGKLITWSMISHPFQARRGAQWYFCRVLAPRNDPKTLDFMCSCETLSFEPYQDVCSASGLIIICGGGLQIPSHRGNQDTITEYAGTQTHRSDQLRDCFGLHSPAEEKERIRTTHDAPSALGSCSSIRASG